MAALKLMQQNPNLPENHTLHNYKYQANSVVTQCGQFVTEMVVGAVKVVTWMMRVETSLWSAEEIEAYQQAMVKYDKDFFLVSKQVGTKSVRQCTEFYFLWKKVCIDEWRRMRAFRRRRIQDYQLRSTADQDDSKSVDDSASVSDTQIDGITNPDEFAIASTAAEVVIHTTNTRFNVQPPTVAVKQNKSTAQRPPTAVSGELFPCRVCGKVFDRVKSRSAHMKSHRQMEPVIQRRPPVAYGGFTR